MRRKRRRKSSIIKILLLLILLLSITSVGYSYLSAALHIRGEVTGTVNEKNYILASGSNPDLKIMISKTDTWQANGLYMYKYTFKFTNAGLKSINNFKITIEYLNKVETVSITNYEYTISGKVIEIINNNYILDSGDSKTVSFTISSKASTQVVNTVKLETYLNDSEVPREKFNVDFTIINSSGTYQYQYNVKLTNKTGVRIAYWQLNITLPEGTRYVSGSSALFNYDGNILVIKNDKNNGRLNNNESTTIGVTLSTNIINYIPSSIRITVR